MQTLKTVNPATQETIDEYPYMDWSSVNTIINGMDEAQTSWQKTSYEHRSQPLNKLADLFEEQKNQLGKLITQEMGKPIKQAIGEIEKCAWVCRHYANNSEAMLQPQKLDNEIDCYRCFEPLGVIYAIMPWNFPFWQVMRCFAPNVMLGNAVVLKHAPNCTGVALAIERLCREAGFPDSIFRAIIIDTDLSPKVIHHPSIQGVTLTGSNRAGKAVATDAGSAMKKVVLELGGTDPYVILQDADLDNAAKNCVGSRFLNTGQVCIAAKRIIVESSIYEDFIEKVRDLAKDYQCGDPTSLETNIGPIARSDLLDNLEDQVKRSIDASARCLQGGERESGTGNFFQPTVLADVDRNNPAFTEEVFGPVIAITPADSENEAIELANQSEYGLGAAVFTQDLEKGYNIAKNHIEAGTCNVNKAVASDPRLPFGGIKQSGFGRELAEEGLKEFANIKTVCIQDV